MRKFLSIALVLVLLAGVGAFAAEDEDRALTGSWENELTLAPNDSAVTYWEYDGGIQTTSTQPSTGGTDIADFDSTLTIDYDTGGISFTSISEFGFDGFTDQEFSAVYSVGTLDMTSTVNLNPSGGTTNPLDYMQNTGNFLFGDVEMSLTHLLQHVDWAASAPGYKSDFWPGVSYSNFPQLPKFSGVGAQVGIGQTGSSSFSGYGSGLQFEISGETPGGISVTATTDLGMMPVSDAEYMLNNDLKTKVKNDMVSTTGVSSFSDLTGEDAADYLETKFSGDSAWDSGDVLDIGDNNVDIPKEAAAFFANQLSVGDADGSSETTSTLTDKAYDFKAYVDDDSSLGELDVSTSTISSKMRSAVVSAIKGQIAISGVAAETGKVVSAHVDLDGVGLEWFDPGVASSTSSNPHPLLLSANVSSKYGPSSIAYYSTKLELTGFSLGCCDFDNITKFSQPYNFEYTKFTFSLSENTFGLDISANLMFDFRPWATNSGKSVTLTPTIKKDWTCFTVYSSLATSNNGSSITGLDITGFKITADLGHVNATWAHALSGSVSSFGPYHAYDQVLSFVKKDEYPLNFTLDIYNNEGGTLIPDAVDGSALYPISDQFDFGADFALTTSGLQELGLTFDYYF